jgi:superfamily II DNA or RNA helicase
MDVIEFLPKYPNIDDSKYPVLNPYKSNFYEAIFQKKEFYQNRLDRVEAFPRERGVLTKYQQIITRYMSSHSPYDKILLVHAMGTGKTCSAVGAIEQIREERGHIFDGAIILAKGTPVLDNFAKELVEKCTPGQYLPENYTRLTA